MISLSAEQYEKIRLIDKLFDAVSTEKLREISESEQIVARLKGVNHSGSGFITQIINDNTSHSSELMNLRSEVAGLRSDLQVLMKLTFKPYEYNAVNDAQSLKSKYGIY